MSQNNSLVLHTGGQLVTREELETFQAPPATKTWTPVSHHVVLDSVVGTLAAAGYVIGKQQLAVARDGQRFFGVLDLTTALDTGGGGVSLSVGIRNSNDKSLPLGFVAGNRVFVCDNLAFSAELMVRRRHTRFGKLRFQEAIDESVKCLAAFAKAETARIHRLKETKLTEDKALALMVKSIEAEVIAPPSLPALLKEWRTPSHDYGTGADPTDYAKRTMRLGLLLNNETAPATTTLAA